jgi:hypothetical protein
MSVPEMRIAWQKQKEWERTLAIGPLWQELAVTSLELQIPKNLDWNDKFLWDHFDDKALFEKFSEAQCD